MKTKILNVLLVDDHPLILEAYEKAFSKISEQQPQYHFNLDRALNCEHAFKALHDNYHNKSLHLVFLDINLPSGAQRTLRSGEDLGKEIRKSFPKAKIVVITTFNNNYLIQSVLQNINPEGFMIKADINLPTMLAAIMEILQDPPFYSKTVINSMRHHIAPEFLLDAHDREILHQISLGKKTKDLPNFIPLSLRAIEKRKHRLKEIFDIENGTDIDLVRMGREKGFL